MAHRKVKDDYGVEWEIWEVMPTMAERRERGDDMLVPGMTERRRQPAVRMRLPADMKEGWLAMSSDTERRRLAPIPRGWEHWTDKAIVHLIELAEPTGVSRRLIE